jgi:hypothetical protein
MVHDDMLKIRKISNKKKTVHSSVAEPHHFYAAPTPAPARAPAPTLL